MNPSKSGSWPWARCSSIVVELGQHVLHPGHVLGRHRLHRARHLVDEALHELLAQLVDQLLELLAGLRGGELVLLQRLHLAGEVGRQEVEVHLALLDDLVGDLLAALVRPTRAASRASSCERGPLLVDDLPELVGDLVVDPAEVVVLEHLPALLAQAFHDLPQALEVLAVGGVEARLEHAAQGGVEVAVVQQVVGDLRHDLVGAELEADLGAVPARVAEPGSSRIAPEERHRPSPALGRWRGRRRLPC